MTQRTEPQPTRTPGVARGGATSRPAVEVRDLVKTYPKPGGGYFNAVNGLSFEVQRGEIFGFLGPNGAGKTTSLEIIEGIRKPTSGEVRVLGVDSRHDLDKIKEVIGVQLQADSYFSLLTIEEILELFGSFYPKRRPPGELLDTVGLLDKRKAYVRQLSGGQKRRFSVAAALVNDPDVVFLDEPTTGLDPKVRRNLWELVQRLNHDEHKTIVLTTHYMEEAELLSHRIAIIDHGEIQAIDTPRELITRFGGDGHIDFATSSPVDTDDLANLDFDTGQTVIGLPELMITGAGIMMVAAGNTHAFVSEIATYKATGVLKRIAVTPISRVSFIIGEVAPRIAIGVTVSIGYLALGALSTDIELGSQTAGVLVVVLMITVTSLTWGFFVAGFTKTPMNANALDTFSMFWIFMLNGAMLPLDALPGALPDIVKVAVSFAAPIEAIRGITLYGTPITSYGPEILIGAAWALTMLTVATTVYRFDKE